MFLEAGSAIHAEVWGEGLTLRTWILGLGGSSVAREEWPEEGSSLRSWVTLTLPGTSSLQEPTSCQGSVINPTLHVFAMWPRRCTGESGAGV